MADRIAQVGDLWSNMADERQGLQAAARRLA
jgi:hypothetical protein